MRSKVHIRTTFVTRLKFKLAYILGLATLFTLFALSCNPTRDRKINRAWHSLTGRYNVYFNGEQKLLDATETLTKGHVNDFTKILEVFPYGDEAAAKGVSAPLDEVLKKASSSIQNHTVGNYTDDSYLLMGKAHYFKRDYFAAIEAFQYINARYKDKGLRPISSTWIVKSYMGLKKPDESEAIMSMVLSEFGPKTVKGKPVKESFWKKIKPDFPRKYNLEMYATAADIAIKQGKYAPAAQYLSKALSFSRDKRQKIRFHYILGQLYLAVDSAKLANKHFSKILSMNAPYEFEFNAGINIARAYDLSDKSAVKKVKRSLRRMLKDDKNDGLYDQIHYELAKLEYRLKNIPEAIKQYKLSVGKSTKNQNQKALSYLALGNIYLELPDYRLAQAYYDSTAATISKDYRDYQKIIGKKELLSELISHLIVIETQDSLQRLSKLSPAQLDKKIEEWKLAQKLAAEQKAKEEKARKEAEKNAPVIPASNPALSQNFGGMGGATATWYFYNTQTVAAGSAEFFSMKKWGKRSNEDYWRLSNKQKEKQADNSKDPSEENASQGDQKNDTTANNEATTKTDAAGATQDRDAWLKDIPFTKDALQKSNDKLVSAFFDIGVLYDEKLMDPKEAVKAFESILERFPGSPNEAEVLYRLYKIYMKQKDEARAKVQKAKLITMYPESPYALIIQDKPIASTENDTNKDLVKAYENMYAKFQAAQYADVLKHRREVEQKFPGNSMAAKFDLLQTLSIGKLYSVDSFKVELELLIKTYAKTDVADFAQQILDAINGKNKPTVKDSAQASKEFEFVATEPHYVVFATRADKFDVNEALSVFNNYNDEYESTDNLKVNNYLSNDGYQLIMIRDFASMEKAKKYIDGLVLINMVKNKLKFSGEHKLFFISSKNFKKMLKEQKVDVYDKQYQEYIATIKSDKK